MKNQLSILISRQADMESRIAGRVRRVADIEGTLVEEWSRDLRLSSESPRTVDVEPGRYIVEAFWRDGRLTSQMCLVDREATSVRLRPPSGRSIVGAAPRDFSKPSASGMAKSAARDTYSIFGFDMAREAWTELLDRVAIGHASNLSADSWPAPRTQDIALQLENGKVRSWVMYWATDGWVVSSLPATATENEKSFLRSRPEGLPFVAAGDPDMMGMTDLLPSGNSEAAHRYASATLSETPSIEELVARRPLELCAFAYAEYENFGENEWMSALLRAAEREAWPSDVLVLSGWRRLMSAAGGSDWKAAGDLLEHAVDRGVPYYSLGVKLLADALTLLASALPAHRESAQMVRSLAARTLPTEAFTTIRL